MMLYRVDGLNNIETKHNFPICCLNSQISNFNSFAFYVRNGKFSICKPTLMFSYFYLPATIFLVPIRSVCKVINFVFAAYFDVFHLDITINALF